MSRIVAAHKLEAHHLAESIKGSGISKAIASLNLKSIVEPKEIAELLNWSRYLGTPGWYVNSADLHTGNLRHFGQFKPTFS